jgi:hypothetical protein
MEVGIDILAFAAAYTQAGLQVSLSDRSREYTAAGTALANNSSSARKEPDAWSR